MNQAFVKAFTRRPVTENNQQTTTPPAASAPQPGVLKVDASVADSAAVWVDKDEAGIARADVAEADPLKPHVAPAEAPASETIVDAETRLDEQLASIQQMHTACLLYTSPSPRD